MSYNEADTVAKLITPAVIQADWMEDTIRRGVNAGPIENIEKKASAIEDAVYDLKAVNPFVSPLDKPPTVADLLDVIEREGQKVAEALAKLRELKTRRNN